MVASVGVLAGQNGKFTVHVIECGRAKKQHADRAMPASKGIKLGAFT
ncbi:hypothetical protein [Bradyrhizobium sp.]|jgi:hypothetical protein